MSDWTLVDHDGGNRREFDSRADEHHEPPTLGTDD